MRRFGICITAVIVLTLTLKSWAENSASGSLTVNGSATEIKYSYVDKGPENMIIVVTDKALEKDDIPFGLHILSMEDKARGLAFTVSSSTKELSSGLNAIYHPEWSGQLGTIGNGVLTISRFDETEISGKISTPGENTFGEYKYSYDVSFSVKLDEPKDTEPLNVEIKTAEDAPSKAYAAYYKAIMSGNKDEIRKHLSSKVLDQATDENIGMIVELAQIVNPTSLNIKGSEINGNEAIVHAEVVRDGEKSTGSITMSLEDGAWKVVKDSWKSGMQ